MATAKQDARKVLDGLPEEAALEDIQYHLYVLQSVMSSDPDRFAAQARKVKARDALADASSVAG